MHIYIYIYIYSGTYAYLDLPISLSLSIYIYMSPPCNLRLLAALRLLAQASRPPGVLALRALAPPTF